MARYSANNPNRTLTLHRDNCSHVSTGTPQNCGCGSTSTQGNQQWWCETHVGRDHVDTFMGGRFWAILLCDACYR